MATASFLLLNQTVRTELLQTTNFGMNWSQVSPGAEFIPLGPPGAFDSYTTYTSWSGTSAPLLDPKNPNRTMFYYSGGDGPHDGQRDDSIGLAYATTHAYAGLKRTDGGVDASVKSSLKTTPLLPFHGKGYDNSTRVRWHLLASIGSNDGEKGAAEQARSGRSAPSLRARTLQKGATESTAYIDVPLVANGAAQWVEIAASGSMPHAEPVVWEFECVGECTLFAVKSSL